MSDGPVRHQVNGTTLACFESGTGEPIVFVHGGITDHRFWAPQVETLSHRFRCIAVDQRYFGQSWPNGGDKFALSTHADDLCQLLRAIAPEPVHVVATSYGSGVALASAVTNPEGFKSLFLNEPSLASLVAEPEDISVLAQARRNLAPAVAALAENDLPRAVELFCDWTAFPGAFASLTEELKAVFFDNARALALQLAAPPPSVTAAQISALRMPVTFATGDQTTQFFAVQVRAAHRAVAHSRLVRVAGAHHAASFENTAAFNAALLEHLAQT